MIALTLVTQYRHITDNLKWRTDLKVMSEWDDDNALWMLVDIKVANNGWLFMPVSELTVDSVSVQHLTFPNSFLYSHAPSRVFKLEFFHESAHYHSLPPDAADCMTVVKDLVDKILGANNYETEEFYSGVDNRLDIEYSDAARHVKVRLYSHPGYPESIVPKDLWKDYKPKGQK